MTRQKAALGANHANAAGQDSFPRIGGTIPKEVLTLNIRKTIAKTMWGTAFIAAMAGLAGAVANGQGQFAALLLVAGSLTTAIAIILWKESEEKNQPPCPPHKPPLIP